MKYHNNVYRSFTLIMQFGINMLVPVFLCSFLGIYLDQKFNTSFCMIILFFVGALAGGRNVYRMAAAIFNQKSEKDKYENKKQNKENK